MNVHSHLISTYLSMFPFFSPLLSELTFTRSGIHTHNLKTAHWTHMYLYSNTHTLTQCPSLAQPPTQTSIKGNPVPFSEKQEEPWWPTFLKKREKEGGGEVGWHGGSTQKSVEKLKVCWGEWGNVKEFKNKEQELKTKRRPWTGWGVTLEIKWDEERSSRRRWWRAGQGRNLPAGKETEKQTLCLLWYANTCWPARKIDFLCEIEHRRRWSWIWVYRQRTN